MHSVMSQINEYDDDDDDDDEYGMDVNVKKTKVMVFSKEENVQCNIKVNGEYLEQVTSYRYLRMVDQKWK